MSPRGAPFYDIIEVRDEYGKIINPGDRVKISENAMEDAPAGHPERFIKSKNAGVEGTYIGDLQVGEVPFAVIEFDNEKQDIIRKQYVEPL